MYITMLCLVSREGAEELILGNIKRTLIKNNEFEIVLVIDNKNISALKYQILLEPLGFRNIEIINTGNPPPSQFTMHQRRNRIANNHNMAKDLIGGSQFVFCFEDDTVVPKHTLRRLLLDYADLNGKHNVGFIEGVQVGRWGRPYIGAWLVDDIEKPSLYKSILPNGTDLEEIDAGGFYSFITPTVLYKEHEFKWQEPVGPDVNYGLELKKKGYTSFIDWRVACGHKTPQSTIKLHKNIVELEIENRSNRWHFNTIKGVNL